MLATIAALAGTLLLAPGASAQDTQDNSAAPRYVVWSSVVFTRTGERTPEILGETPPQLTSTGAQEAYAAGSFFRSRYMRVSNGTVGDEASGGELVGLDKNRYDQGQTYSLALEQQYNLATQQAFMQGLYPAYTPANGTDDDADPYHVYTLANGTVVRTPLNGYQYPQLRSAGPNDPNYIYLSGNLGCPSFDIAAELSDTAGGNDGTDEEFNGTYAAVGSAALIGVLDQSYWSYDNAYAIYDYLRFQDAYNETVRSDLANYRSSSTNATFLSTLRWLADEQQYGQLGNLTAQGLRSRQRRQQQPVEGSISTVAGNTLAARVLELLSGAINYSDFGRNKLNLLFADYHPLTSFFALAGLPQRDPRFYGTANFASSVVFELFSITNDTTTFPSTNDLYVRFLFRNGTVDDDSNPFRAYPLFGRANIESDMTWEDFRDEMSNIALSGVGNWCNECGSRTLFCAAFDEDGNETDSASRGSSRRSGLAPAVAGVVGAIIALVIAGLLFALAMLIGGVRVRREKRDRKHDLGGFKGGAKMQSDQDLTIPKGGAMVGASVVEEPRGHERVGSWEMKNAEAGRNHLDVSQQQQQQQDPASLRPSMEEARHDPFADPDGIRPTQTREHV
ncbi:hypothetical protein CERZMDRAFT_64463 [Cercospora zeae-maydis SCOH1-5]|uniref:Histidine acid phosphatase n=1 Tax=Cercospora zeae-maydis SCOH1-5 TaxID=717836 RepID=A0A6A6FUG1_9PEZI|nr:hypothetical protein CERZMDRAFT_64463 [Cercospora zeae-maydis SCOH1-5]